MLVVMCGLVGVCVEAMLHMALGWWQLALAVAHDLHHACHTGRSEPTL
jgi:hypothetical protein